MKKLLGWGIGILLILAIVFGVWWFWQRAQRPQTVRAGVVAPITMQEDVYATGSVVPASVQEVRVLTPGLVSKVAVKVGDTVKVGQTLVTLDTTLVDAQVAQAKAGVEAAQTSVNAAQANLQELKKAHSEHEARLAKEPPTGGNLSSLLPQFADEQTNIPQVNPITSSVLRQAEGVLAQSKSALKQAQEMLKVAQAQRGQMVHKATLGGTVLEVNAQGGNLSPVQQPLVVVADLTKMNVEAELNEVDAGKVRPEGKVAITSRMLGDKPVQGTIVEIAPTAVSRPSVQGNTAPTVGVKIRLDEVPAELKPGFTVSIEIIVATKKGILAVPQEVLFQEGNKNFVYRIADGRLQKTEVTIGIGNDTHQEIMSGLKSGDLVALNPSKDFSEGMVVTPDTESGGV